MGRLRYRNSESVRASFPDICDPAVTRVASEVADFELENGRGPGI
jgi:hypothetical protein